MPDSEARAYKLLTESQNATFDQEFHPPSEFAHKVSVLREIFGTEGPKDILDVGGGNGLFVDALLTAFPTAQATVFDVSKILLDRNSVMDRKILVEGSIEDIEATLGGGQFDLITANWLLHHLVGKSYAECSTNVIRALKVFHGMLRPGGMLAVAENMFNGFSGSNLPSRVIWVITSASFRPWVRIASKAFNTAGVGVCFHSEDRWRQIFSDAGFQILREQEGQTLYQGFRQNMLPLLGVSTAKHRHFYLRPLTRPRA